MGIGEGRCDAATVVGRSLETWSGRCGVANDNKDVVCVVYLLNQTGCGQNQTVMWSAEEVLHSWVYKYANLPVMGPVVYSFSVPPWHHRRSPPLFSAPIYFENGGNGSSRLTSPAATRSLRLQASQQPPFPANSTKPIEPSLRTKQRSRFATCTYFCRMEKFSYN